MSHETILWIVFAVLVPTVLVLDLGVFQRRAHTIRTKEALLMTAGYVSLALIFAVVIYFVMGEEGHDKALTFLTGYIVEWSLSMDNLFVFILIFTTFAVPSEHRHRVLFWGIIGAIVTRGIFIATGLTIIEKLEWIIFVFGAFLVYTGLKIAFKKDQEVDPKKNVFFRLGCKYLPMTDDYRGGKFFSREKGRLLATPLILVLIVIETTDIVFAVDSIPAILSITLDSFIVYSSNIFAILGLRALFFALVGLTNKLVYLSYGLAAILTLLGLKMIFASDLFAELTGIGIHVPVYASLGAVVGILAFSALASFWWPPKKKGILSNESGVDTEEQK
ncbi:MAG: tellurium resistance protein TerC [Chloroflexi bacterium RBG_13_51_18]|nr:MAG: tellurium resistance protein TerC [Chloroflexi bacterium RBG_13_51_18]